MTPTTPSGAGGLVDELTKDIADARENPYNDINAVVLSLPFADRILAALRSQGWVSVKERLPEPAKPALLWDGKRQWCGRIDAELAAQYHVTHYMPLPSPPATTKD